MRTRARNSSGGMMSEGPVAMSAAGGDTSPPSGDPLDLLPVLNRDDPLVYTGARASASVAMPPSLSEPWSSHRLRADSFSNLIGALTNDDIGPYEPVRRRSSGGRSSSPDSLPALERVEDPQGGLSASLSSSDDMSSLSDAAVAGLVEMGGLRDDDTAADEPGAEVAAATSPFTASAAAAPSMRRSSRAAAHRAMARVSAALHSGGMADFDEAFGTGGVGSGSEISGTMNPYWRGSAARAGVPEDGSDDDDDSIVIAAEPPRLEPPSIAVGTAAASASASSSGVARGRARRRAAGPKTTGESPAQESAAAEPPVALRRSARTRNAAAASLKDEKPVGVKREAGLKSTGEDDDDVKTEDPTKCEEESCCICLDVPDRHDLSSVNGCEHLYCFGCIEKWSDRENSCPQCKKRFTKIERVHRPPPAKRRRRGEPPAGERAASSKRVKNRDQRADVGHGNPLQGLFATMEANGTMPHSIAQLIFSGLGGINGGLLGSTSRSSGGGSASAAGGPPSRTARTVVSRGMPGEPFPLQPIPTPLSDMVRRLSSINRYRDGPTGAGPAAAAAASRGSAAAPVHLPDPWSLAMAGGSAASLSAARGGAPRSMPHQFGRPGSSSSMPRAHFASPFGHRDSSSGVSDDGLDADFPDFVRRVQQRSVAAGRSADRYAVGSGAASAGATGTFGGPSRANRSAVETVDLLDSDDENDVIEVIEVGED